MFCNKFGKKLRSIYRKFDNSIKQSIDDALLLTTNLKKLLKSDAANLVFEIVPGHWDEDLRQKALNLLSKAIDKIALADECMEEFTHIEKLRCFAKHLKRQSPAISGALLHKLASILTREMDGNRFEPHEYDTLVQAIYSSSKN